MIHYKLQFYSSGINYKNKLFSFNVRDLTDCQSILMKFEANDNKLKSAFWNSYDDGKLIQSYRLNLTFGVWRQCLIPYLKQFNSPRK